MSNLVNVDTGELSVISTDNLIEIASKAEARIEAVKKIKVLSLKVTNSDDWVDQGGKPYLKVSGGEKIARLFGISWTSLNPETTTDGEEGHYMITYKGVFTMAGASIEVIGTRSSKDGFFKQYIYKDKEGKELKNRQELPPGAIDIGDVMKSAYTNLIGNGITRLLGIRNLTYDDLADAGIDVSKISKIEYKSKPKLPQSKSDQKEFNKVVPGANEGLPNEVITSIIKTSMSQGVNKKTGAEFKRYSILGDNDIIYSTFDEKIATLARTCKDAGLKAKIIHEGGKYNNIISIDIVEPEEKGEINVDDFSDIADEALKEAGL